MHESSHLVTVWSRVVDGRPVDRALPSPPEQTVEADSRMGCHVETNNSSDVASASFRAIESLVHEGKAVVSSENSAMVEWATKAIVEGRTIALYLKPTVFEAIRRWYWTPERIKLVGLEPLSAEQIAKVKSDFDLDIDGHANSLDCPRCGHSYSTYEFIQQGIEEHGREIVRSTFSLRRAAILQINPVQNPICRNCRLHIMSSGRASGVIIHYHYDYWCVQGNAYACCSSYVVAATSGLSPS
jgi:hypothetical protein